MAAELSISNARITEGSNNRYLNFTVSLTSPAPSSGVTAEWRTRSGTAIDRYDFQRDSGTIRIGPGETSTTLSVYIYGDTVDEVDENFFVDLVNPSGAVLAGNVAVLTATGVILDDDGTGSNLALSLTNPIVYEGNVGPGVARIEASLSQAATSTISIPYQSVNASAVAGQDYGPVSGTLTFLPGQTTAIVEVPVFGDTGSEPTETFSVVFAPPPSVAGGAIGAASTVTILDDDASAAGNLPTISIADSNYAEGANNGYMRFDLTLSAPAPSSGVSVEYRTRSGTGVERIDFAHEDGKVTFRPGETAASLDVYMYGDTADEADDSLFLELFNPVGAALPGGALVVSATGVILDDDGIGSNLALFATGPVVVEGNSGSKIAHVNVRLSQPASSTIVVPYRTVDGTATAGQDYTAVSGSLTFLPGQTVAAVDVAILGDTMVEPTEAFSVVFTPPPSVADGTSGSGAIITILADDAAVSTLPVLTIRNASYAEGSSNGYMYFDVTLSAPAPSSGVAVNYRTVAGTAVENLDFHGESGRLVLQPGETSGTISIYMYGDTQDEFDENFSIELYNPVGAVLAGNTTSLLGNVEILDDDGIGANLSLATINPTVIEGNGGTTTMHFEALLSRPSATAVVVPYQTFNGTAVAGQDYVATAGSLTFLPGQTTASVDVGIIGDLIGEPSETFSVLFSASAVTAAISATGTIVNDDSTGPILGVIDSTTGGSSVLSMEAASAGGPSYLKWQYIYGGNDSLTMSTQAEDVFLHSGGGFDALQVSSGHNVLDGGTGSNFMTGGTGIDTFFTDARGSAVVWNTLRNYGAGDAATLWGFTPGVSSYRWEANIAGAAGSEGATLRANIVGGAGRNGDGVDASITFTGMSVAQARNLQIVTGTVPAGSYLYIYNPGV